MSIFELLGSKRIQKIDAVAFPGLIDSRENLIRNGDFSSGDFAGWYNSLGGCSINSDPAKVWLGKYSAKLPGISGVYVLQDLPPLYGDELAFIFRAISDDGNPHLFYTLVFSDGTYESGDFATLKSNWTIQVWEPTTHKAVAFIYIGNATAGNNSVFLASVAGIRKNNVTQSTRTLLKVQPEREDLISFGGNYTPNAVAVQVVAPSGSLKPKIYDVSMECAVDGLHYLMFAPTATLTTRRLCSIITKGKYGKTLVMPRVGNAGDGIYAYSAVNETNWQIDLGYVLE